MTSEMFWGSLRILAVSGVAGGSAFAMAGLSTAGAVGGAVAATLSLDLCVSLWRQRRNAGSSVRHAVTPETHTETLAAFEADQQAEPLATGETPPVPAIVEDATLVTLERRRPNNGRRAGDSDMRPSVPWTTRLPELLEVLVALSEKAVEDTNEASMGYVKLLNDIETKVMAVNQGQVDSLGQLETLDKMAETSAADRAHLTRSVENARAVGDMIRGEITSSRSAIADVGAAIGQMQKELSTVSEIAEKINILAINASIEAARAGDEGSGFQVISQNIRSLANETHGITSRLGPLIRTSTKTIQSYGDTRSAGEDKQTDVLKRIEEQSTLLAQTDEMVERLTTEFTSLIDTRRTDLRRAISAGEEVEDTIQSALAAAQTGDIVRQQIEAVIDAINEVHSIARGELTPPVAAERLQAVLDGLVEHYVMDSQRQAHLEVLKRRHGEDVVLAADHPEPTLELF